MKRSIFAVISILAISFALIGARQAQSSRSILTRPVPPADQKIAYGSDPNQFGELRLPKGPGKFPVVVIVHGGCWMAEYGLGYMGHLAADLTDAGFATWNIEYRRVGNSGGAWPGTFQDVGMATDYLRTLAKKYPLDLNRVAALGHSAGGQLVIWLGVRSKFPKDSPVWSGDPLKLRAIVPIAAITDLRKTGTACDESLSMLMGNGPKDKVSPVEMAPLGIRQLIVAGEDDKIVPPSMARDYYDIAVKKGDLVKLLIIPKAGHFEPVDPKTPAWQQVREGLVEMMKK